MVPKLFVFQVKIFCFCIFTAYLVHWKMPVHLEHKEKCGTKIIRVSSQNFLFLHFHRLPCALENACALYKITRKFAFFFGEYQIYFIS